MIFVRHRKHTYGTPGLATEWLFFLCVHDNIKMEFLEIGLNVVDWIGLAQDRYRWRALVNSVMNILVQ
jgi:hypothetical protein